MQGRILTIAIVIFMATCFGLYGCGDVTLLDEIGDRYQAHISSLSDAEEDDILTIDTVLSICDATAVPIEYEIWTDVFADIEVSIAEDVPGLTLNSYSISYTYLGSANSNSEIVNPPQLSAPLDGSYLIRLESGETTTFTIPVMTVDTKDEFSIDMGWLDPVLVGGVRTYSGLPIDPNDLQVGRYLIAVTLHFVDDYGIEKDITVDVTVLLSGYNNC